MIVIGAKDYGLDTLGAFRETAGWNRLTEEQQSIWEAYLRRSERYPIDGVLRAIGAEGVSVPALTPVPPQALVLPPLLPVTMSTASSLPTSVPVPSADIIPPSFEQLQLNREAADRAFRRNQVARASSSSSSSAPSSSSVTLTKAEIQSAKARAIANSDRFSGHGRPPHGSRASSSSAATLAEDQRRSRESAVERELDKELQRKKNQAAGKMKK